MLSFALIILMGFFDFFWNLFKRKADIIVLKPENAEAFLEKELSAKKKKALDESARVLAEIKHSLKELPVLLHQLDTAKMAEKSARLDRIVETSKSSALRQLSSLLEKLQPPNSGNLEEIKRYCFESMLALQQAGQFGKNVAYAGISFKEEMKGIGAQMKQLSGQILSLKKILEENNAVFSLPLLKQKMLQLRNAGQSIDFAEKELLELQRKLSESSKEKTALNEKLQKLRNSPEFANIAELNEKKAQLLKEKQSAKTELLDLFAKIERPLSRLDKATKAGKVFFAARAGNFFARIACKPFQGIETGSQSRNHKGNPFRNKKGN